MAAAEHEGDRPPEPGDWRTSPTTGELEFFDGREWLRSGPPAGGSDLLIRPAPPGGQPAGAEDAAGSGADPG